MPNIVTARVKPGARIRFGGPKEPRLKDGEEFKIKEEDLKGIEDLVEIVSGGSAKKEKEVIVNVETEDGMPNSDRQNILRKVAEMNDGNVTAKAANAMLRPGQKKFTDSEVKSAGY